MSSRNRLTFLFSAGIGAAGKFKNVTNEFVRSEPKEGSLSDGFLLLRLTSDELLRVRDIARELQGDYPDGFDNLQWQHRSIMKGLETLLYERENTSPLNFIKQNQIRRSAETLYRSGNALYNTAKTVSERAKRDLQAFRIAKARVNKVEATDIAENEQVMGISLDGPLQIDSDQASTLPDDTFVSAVDELFTRAMSLGDTDGHGDIPASGVLSNAEHVMSQASAVLVSRADSTTIGRWMRDQRTRGNLAGGDGPGFGDAPQNGTFSSTSPVNRTGNQTIPFPVPDTVGGNIPDFGSDPGVQIVPSGVSPTVPHPPSNNFAPADRLADLEAHVASPTPMKDGNKNNGPPSPQQAGPGAQGAAYPTPPRSPAHNPGEPSPPPSGPPRQSSAFEDFLANHDAAYGAHMYTTVDGEKRGEGLEASHLIQIAEVLRETTKSDVVRIVQEFRGLSDSDKESCITLVRDAPILPGLVAYIYTHLIVCPRRRLGILPKDDWTKHVVELASEVIRWRGRGGIECVLSYDMVKSSLMKILDETKVRPEQHTCNSALSDGTMLMKQDIQNLAALVALCITGPDKSKILGAEGNEAATLVNLFHSLLDAGVELDDWCRRCLFDALIPLTKNGRCPPGLYLSQDIISGLAQRHAGGFGIVFQGKIGSRVVAVKHLKRDECAGSHDKALFKEAIVWRHLRHPNCLPLYGVYVIKTRHGNDEPTAINSLVSPWMDRGTLFNYLESTPAANRTILILDMVRGLNYLHLMRPHVAHRDIKPDNILVTKRGRACFADFGLASVFDMDPQFRTATAQLKMAGTSSYMAPEIFNAKTEEDKHNLNKRLSDMYSLGCTIYATYTGKHPFHDVFPELIPSRVINGQRPLFPEGRIPLDMWRFIENLWGPEPSKRLTTEKALAWMEFKARSERIDARLPAFEEEWLWKESQVGGPLSVA